MASSKRDSWGLSRRKQVSAVFDRNWKFYRKQSAQTKLLAFLIFLIIIGYLIVFPISQISKGFSSPIYSQTLKLYQLFNPSLDGGYFEQFQYVLLCWSSALSFLICFKQNKFVYPIPIIYLFLFLDDALGIHNIAFNNLLIPLYQDTFLEKVSIFRIKDFAEISYWVSIFSLILLIIYPAYKYGNFISRQFIFNNFKFFILLAFFGIFIDLVQSNFFRWFNFDESTFVFDLTNNLLVYFEEAGEITIIAIIFIWLFDIASNKKLLR